MAENSAQSNAQRAVLVTGSSSGIGKEIALYLARQGFLVFASVRREESVGELREYGEPNLLPLFPLDLAIPRTIADASEKVVRELERRRLPGLYGVVNNAGGGGVGPIELMSTAQFQGELTARLVGPVDLLQRLLPSVRAAGGRVVWIVTPATVPIPFVGSIHVCDFAANGLARTLAIELGQRRTPQIMVRCGGIATGSPE
ncbi:MAG TPA: SDR family NAD(P)-dependent oxidoreductase, partial [Spirochaetia bacterium]|nr:SDR family NAD(P)-dependent oxidoreductase [Spirochaetia bacterium]